MAQASAPAAQPPAKPGLGVGKPCSTTLTAMDPQGGAADRGASRRTAFLRLGAYGTLLATVLAGARIHRLVPVGGRGARLGGRPR